MRTINFIFLVLVCTLLFYACTTKKQESRDSDLPNARDTYFGQKAPGLTPKIFGPGVISLDGRFESAISFSPDLAEMYFSVSVEGKKTAIYYSKLEDNEWTTVKRANFTKGKKQTEMHPFVSPNGKRIYFTATDSSFVNEKIWYVNRTEDSWSAAIELDSPINDGVVFAPNQAKNGDLFYTEISGRNINTNYAPLKNGKYTEVQEVNIGFGHHAFISPSQDYLLVTGQNKEDENRKDNDLYVYFKRKDRTWTKPINLGSTINSGFDEVSPRITPDGKYLFFSRSNNLYWVSTAAILKLLPINLRK